MAGCLECLVPGVLAMLKSVIPYQIEHGPGARMLILSCPAVSFDFDGVAMHRQPMIGCMMIMV